MNIPAGSVVKVGIDLGEISVKSLLKELIARNHNGYLAVTIHSGEELEEGTLVFDHGQIKMAVYQYFKESLGVPGDHALPRVFNAFKAKNGVIDIYKLTPEQLQLLIAFNKDALLSRMPLGADIETLFPPAFDKRYRDQIISMKEEKINRSSLMRTFGLSELEAETNPERKETLKNHNIENPKQGVIDGIVDQYRTSKKEAGM